MHTGFPESEMTWIENGAFQKEISSIGDNATLVKTFCLRYVMASYGEDTQRRLCEPTHLLCVLIQM